MKLLKKLFIPLCLTAITMAGVTACSALEPIESSQDSISISVPDPITYTLNLTADKTTAKRGEEVTLAAYLHSEEAEDELAENAIYSIVEGGGAATLAGNKLTISNTAVANTVIKVKAKIGITDSNVIEIKVDVPLEEVSISAGGVTNVLSGSSVTLTKTVYPEGADTSNLVWEIVEGATLATINGDVLVVNDKVPTGAIIKVKAVSGDIESDKVLSFIVGYPLEDLNLAKPTVTNVLKGGKVDLTVTKTPENATESYTWEFVEGKDLASFVGDTLIVNENVATGSIIKVKAVCGDIETITVEFMVGYPLKGLTITQPETENILSGGKIDLTVTKTPENATDAAYSWTFVEGEGLATFVGDTLIVNQGVATGEKIAVKAVCGSFETDVVEFTVGYPLKELNLTADVSTNVPNGDTITFSVSKVPENTTNGDFEWKITAESDSYYTFDETTGKLTVTYDAPLNTEISVQAVGAVESDIITIIVGVPLTGLAISSDAPEVLTHGASYDITVKGTPEEANTKYVQWVFNNKDWASVKDGKLVINSTAPHGATLKVKAVSGNVESNELSYQIGVGVSSLEVTVLGKKNVNPGESTQLTVSALPENATDKSYTWEVVGNGKIVNDYLIVNSDAQIGDQIIVKAVSTKAATVVKSEPVTITVGTPVTGVSISLDDKNIDPGKNAQIDVRLEPTGASTMPIIWDFEEGEKYCTINDKNVITIKDNAPIGTTITFKAVVNGHTSNSLTVTVGTPVTGVSISLLGSANVNPGDFRTIKVSLEPTNASTMPITWEFEAGENLCTIVDNILTVNQGVEIGKQIVFKAVVNGHTSNVISITVGTPITGITVDPEIASGSTVERGTRFDLDVTLEPAGANAAYSWVFVQGGDWASVKNGKLVLSAETPNNTVVELYAASGDVKSTTLSYTVTLTEYEVNAGKYYFVLSGESFLVDKNATSATTLKVELYNYNYEKITDKEFLFTVTSGGDFVEVTKNGAVCTFKAIGHGTANVQITVNGLNISETVVVEAIVPPTSILLPEVFAQRTGYNYNFSMYDHNDSTLAQAGKDALPFVATANGTNVCTDVVYTFRHSDGSTGDAVATYADGKITFNRTGLITVTASSASGSRVETTAQYTFNVNEGYNVYTFEEASALMRNSEYTGQVVNFVVLEKPVGDYAYEYEYDLVPKIALKNQSEQDFLSVFHSYETRITAVNKSVHINGNNHRINVSQLRLFTETEIDEQNNLHGTSYVAKGAVISAEPWTGDYDGHPDVVGDFYARFYDLELIGNTDVNYKNEITPGKFVGGYMAGLNVGNIGYSAKYEVDIENVTASAFREGFKMVSIVDGEMRKAHAYNCYQNGFAFRSSIMTIEDLKLGPCGAVGIELNPESSDTAGRNDNQPQTITFKGSLDVEGNLNALNTSYLQTYSIMGYTIPQIVMASLQNAGVADNATQMSHLQNEKGEVCMVTFIIDLSLAGDVSNASQALYPSYQAGGIIDAADLPSDGTIDTEHQFIRLPASLAPGMPLGSVLLYNLNYGK